MSSRTIESKLSGTVENEFFTLSKVRLAYACLILALVFYYPFEWIFGLNNVHVYILMARLFVSVVGVVLGKLWKDKGFLLLATILLFMYFRVYLANPVDLFMTGDLFFNGAWCMLACYSVGHVINSDGVYLFFQPLAVFWMITMTVLSIIGIWAAYMDIKIWNVIHTRYIGISETKRLDIFITDNVPASFLSFTILMTAILAIVKRNNKWICAFCSLSAIVMLIALSLTDSRTSMITVSTGIALIIGVCISCWCKRKSKVEKDVSNCKKTAVTKWTIILVTGVLAFATLFVILVNFPRLFNQIKDGRSIIAQANAEATDNTKINTISNRGYGDPTLTGRTDIWRGVFEVIKAEPHFLIWGTSVVNPMRKVNEVGSGAAKFAVHAHSIYLQILLESGLPGLLIVGGFLFVFITKAGKLMFNDRRSIFLRLIPIIPITILLGETVECITLLQLGYPTTAVLFLTMGITIGLVENSQNN